MRVVLHDYPGHPFQVQLSRALADRGHDVLHLYSASFAGPKGSLAPRPDDPSGFRVSGLDVGPPAPKHRMLARWLQERRYGDRLVQTVAGGVNGLGPPDVILTANTPSFVLKELADWCRTARVPLVAWVQDLYGEAARTLLGQRFGAAGRLVGNWFVGMETSALGSTAGIVAIAEDFVPALQDVLPPGHRIKVIENWTPLEEMPQLQRRNAWSTAQGLDDRFVYMYSGTLGMKHNPELLLALAEDLRSDPAAVLVVNSEGAGADWLEARARERGLENVRVNGFQPFDRLPQVLASADVFLAVLEPEAAAFSVPSKVLTYLAAGRPSVLCVAPENLASRTVNRAQAGLTVGPGDTSGFLEAARRLRADGDLRVAMARSARSWAEEHFDIDRIAEAFEAELQEALTQDSAP